MLTVVIIIGIVLLLLALPFASKFSPIPYFPTNKKDMGLIIDSLHLKDNQVIFDLGAGDGLVIFEAAYNSLKAKLDTKFVAVEVNPILVAILHIRRFSHPNRKNITIIWKDMYKVDYYEYFRDEQTEFIFYLYISPWYLEKAAKMIQKLDVHTRIISYFYPIHLFKEYEKKLEGIHKVYNYELPTNANNTTT